MIFVTICDEKDNYRFGFSETKSGERGSSLKKDKNGNVAQYKKGEYQKSLKSQGYNQKPELRGAQSEEFAIEMAALDGVGKLIGKGFSALKNKIFTSAATETAVTVTTETAVETSVVQANRTAGNAFRDELAAGLAKEGREVTTEVYKWTPFGKRYIDIQVSQGGRILGGIETKVGKSPYTPLQRLKDLWLEKVQGYPVQLVRKP